MPFLYFLRDIANPVLDFIFAIVTYLGDETAFLVVAIFVFWCVNKQKGYYLLSVGFVGTVINQFLKILFRIPRPWVKDPNFTIVESAREAASGYSFPSGHTQTSVGLFGGLALKFKNRAIRIASIALCVLVPLSRMYLGVHTPADVGVSIVIALVLIFVLAPIFEKAERSPKVMYALLFSLTGIMLAYLLFISFWSFPEEVFHVDNVHNYISAVKNAYTLTGCMLGFLVVYTVDLKWLKFDTKAVWWVQIIKVVVGLALVVAVKEGLRAPLEALFGGHLAARAVRYFLMVLVGGILWPMSFKKLSTIKRKNKEVNE
jgi:undecaprenyl-diphosphatase